MYHARRVNAGFVPEKTSPGPLTCIPYIDVYRIRCYIPLPRFGLNMTHLEGQLDITPLICDLMF